MTSNTKNPQPDENQTTGKDGATTSIQEHDPDTNDGKGNGQQGAGGIGGITERTSPNQKGSQPHLGGGDVSRKGGQTATGPTGAGLTEDGDPTSKEKVPNMTSRSRRS